MPSEHLSDRDEDPAIPGPRDGARNPRVRFIGESYRLLFEKNPLPMWVYDVKSLYFLAVNDAAVAHYGYTRNEFLRMTIKDIRPPEDVPALMADLGRLDSGTESIGIWRHLKRDGSVIEVEVRGNEIDFDGHRARIVLANDITERLRMERRLRTEYVVTQILMDAPSFHEAIPRLLRAVCEEAAWEYGEVWLASAAGDRLRWAGTWHVDGLPAGEFQEAGRAMTVIRGIGIPGVTWSTGKPEWLEDLSPQTHFSRELLARRLGLRQGISFPVTGRGRRVLGVMVFFSRAAREPDPAFLDLMEDLGHRMGQSIEGETSEEERRSVEERFSKAFYRSPLPGIISRLDGSRIIEVNDSFVRAFGYAREELVGRTAAEADILRPLEHRAELLAPLSRGEGVQGVETTLAAKDGTLRIGRLWAERIPMASEPTILTIIEDVTDLRKAQALLLQSERLAAIGRTASFVAHELNTPLTNIALLTASVRRQTAEPAVLQRLERIDAQRRVAARIIEELLAFTRRSDLRKEDTDLGVLLRGAAEQAEAYRASAVSVDLALQGAPVRAAVDPLKMSQVFVNLIKNAYQATETGSVSVTLEDAADSVFVSIRDTGKGMPPEVREHLFEPFRTTKPRGEGIGLGLTFVKTMVEAHGGRVEVDSSQGQGTTFRVVIPKSPPEARPGD